MSRILLSPPDVGAVERRLLLEAFDSNWIAPIGPHLDAFEREFAEVIGVFRSRGVVERHGGAASGIAGGRRPSR
jgi:dTDP-4-amino-4,6-dideoxygalactose transaminase